MTDKTIEIAGGRTLEKPCSSAFCFNSDVEAWKAALQAIVDAAKRSLDKDGLPIESQIIVKDWIMSARATLDDADPVLSLDSDSTIVERLVAEVKEGRRISRTVDAAAEISTALGDVTADRAETTADRIESGLTKGAALAIAASGLLWFLARKR